MNYSLIFRRILPQEMGKLVSGSRVVRSAQTANLSHAPQGLTRTGLLENGFVDCFKLLMQDVFLDAFQHLTLSILNSRYC
jgi:hypothetical protein